MTNPSKYPSPTQDRRDKALWGGGFSEAMHPDLARISDSLPQDLPLADADLRASAAYARALARCNVLSPDEGERLATTLETLRQDLHAGRWLPAGVEDIHTAIEAEVTHRLGALGERLHTGRSRNDQVSTAFRLTVAERAETLHAALRRLGQVLIVRAEEEIDTLVPAYTHMQRAQPVRLAHWLLAHLWPLERDMARLREARARALVLPLGSGAVSGHPFDLDRAWLAQELGFNAVSQNSIDSVGERDFAVEFGFVCGLVAVHLSRLAEELVIWSTAEFSYVRWPDSLASGSSLMPNKKNPDLAELVRGRSAGAIGDVVSLLVLLKGLPASYQRDLQEDKPPVWRLADTTLASLRAMTAALEGIGFDAARMQEALTDEVLATEAADVLVAKGVPFRQAHRLVAGVVAEARRRHVGIKALAREPDYVLPEPLSADDLEHLNVTAAIERRTTAGGTAKSAVLAQLEAARRAMA